MLLAAVTVPGDRQVNVLIEVLARVIDRGRIR
jgi:hypothetical protein